MASLRKGLILGLVMGLLGLALSVTPFGWELEETYGLAWLFHLRGPRTPPPEVVVVAIDERSATELHLPPQPREWPRHWHARLIDRLSAAGARVIVFDLLFNKPKTTEDDEALAQAMRNAGNVTLAEILALHSLNKETPEQGISAEIRTRPFPLLANAALGVAPFPLPKIPTRVNNYWAFKPTGDGSLPTLPVVAFQGYALSFYEAFLGVLKQSVPAAAARLPASRAEVLESRGAADLVHSLHELLGENPDRLAEAARVVERIPDPRTLRGVQSLLHLYGGEEVLYLDFYGPHRHITTIPYYQALDPSNAKRFEGKIVCIGFSEANQVEKRGDYFSTVFSQANGLDLSGVEILATAIANLVEDRPVRPLGLPASLGIIFLWGLSFSLLCRRVSTVAAVTGGLALMGLYLTIAHQLFKAQGLWLPLVIPLAWQSPLAFALAMVGKYINIRAMFGRYLPGPVVDEMVHQGDITGANRLVYGVCLATDAEHYTTLAEGMDPNQVGRMMNDYYAAVFHPVQERGGIISDVIGDAMLALWHGPSPDPRQGIAACEGALAIAEAVERFNQSYRYPPLKTRLGLHAGQFLLGSIGALSHLEYRATGDVINTASRIEGLNKKLGTQILVSDETLAGIENLFLTRWVGNFLLAGKSTPITIHELVGRRPDATPDQTWLCASFAEALTVYHRQDWDEARQRLLQILAVFPKDGPSRFYLDRLEHDRTRHAWDGVIRVEK